MPPLCAAGGKAGVKLVQLFRQGDGRVGDLCGGALIVCDLLQTLPHLPSISSRIEAIKFLCTVF